MRQSIFQNVLRLEIKAAEITRRAFRGIATTNAEDLAGDIVEPSGAQFSLPMPLLRQHRHAEPIGEVFRATATENGIEIEAKGPEKTNLGYVIEAWEQIAARLVKGLSVGFQPIEYEEILNDKGKWTGGLHFKKWLWLETSAVTIAMNPQAGLTLRSLARGDFTAAHDREARAALLERKPAAKPARDLEREAKAAAALALADRRLRGLL